MSSFLYETFLTVEIHSRVVMFKINLIDSNTHAYKRTLKYKTRNKTKVNFYKTMTVRKSHVGTFKGRQKKNYVLRNEISQWCRRLNAKIN